ncbi:MAG: ATP-dependent helicase [Gemmatimonadetes bacterium]|nr:ATP-dependent helicase [Gemmatimonadota bacterium]
MNPLSNFHPLIQRWFRRDIGEPTDAQTKVWPRIAAGEHVLLTAPTGSGKTLSAFLWAIDRLVSGGWSTGRTRVLYVSPLKALNNDIRRNLLGPLDSLRTIFADSATPFPSIEVLTRSGDTPPEDRRRMLRHPPEILITTPESLNLILSSQAGGVLLTGIETVILDEIHALLGSKRGTHLITGVERIVRLSGEFQRVALSATVRPLDRVAEFVGGYERDGGGYRRRPVSVVRSADSKAYPVEIRSLDSTESDNNQETLWEALARDLKAVISNNRSTLLFVRSRNICEKVTRLINGDEPEPIVYAHHGALSREIRTEVERRLKRGELRGIVATSSLELGIDIGALDEVVLIQSPESLSSAIQRVGRAGHGVGEISRAILYPSSAHEMIEVAVLAEGILEHDIEESSPIKGPLDVLAQIIVSMVTVEKWDIDALHAHLRTSEPYHHLRRDELDIVLKMLAGRYADSRIRDLRARIAIDKLENTAVARKGAKLALYMSGGTIPDRGYFRLRHRETNALIGELDEEYVWEASIGQSMTLGTQSWRIEQITQSDVYVLPGRAGARDVPFWKAEGRNRDFHLSTRIGEFLENANRIEDKICLKAYLLARAPIDEIGAERLADHLSRQRSHTRCDLPHRHHIVFEHVDAAPGTTAGGNQLIIHTFWGGRVNRPFALALEAAWESRFGAPIETFAANDCICLVLPHEVSAEEILSLVPSTSLEGLLRKRLEASGFFGSRFRECAGRALLLTRNRMNERMPLWVRRLRSQQLLDAVMRYEDFPILLEAWRTCLQDELDPEACAGVLGELESAEIAWSETRSSTPSPFGRSVAWRQVSEYMYRDDTPKEGKRSRISTDLLRDVVFDSGLRPAISPELVERFNLRRRRLEPGYLPSDSTELIEWVKERGAIPLPEWNRLLGEIESCAPSKEIVDPISDRLVRVTPSGAAHPLILALEDAPRIAGTLWNAATVEDYERTGPAPLPPPQSELDREQTFTSIVGEWLRFFGPVTPSEIIDALGVSERRLVAALEDLIDTRELVAGALVEGREEELVCDARNLESLLRMARAESSPRIDPLPLDALPGFLAAYQGLTEPGEGVETLFDLIEQLAGFPAPAPQWEGEILPARMPVYRGAHLDQLMQEGDLLWVGSGEKRIAFWFESELELMEPSETTEDGASNLMPSDSARYRFDQLLRESGCTAADLSERLWSWAWQGEVTNDTVAALRRGIETRFRAPRTPSAPSGRRRRRGVARPSFGQWKSAAPFAGNWHRLPAIASDIDPIEAQERNRDRARLLFDRYGVLFRELLERESALFRWSKLFRTLRLMELSGEIVSGCFFHGIPGLQFASHKALRTVRRRPREDKVFWLSAIDPASLCGIGLDGLRGGLPKRMPGTHIVYRGSAVMMISKGKGREIDFQLAPDDEAFPEVLGPLHHLLGREQLPSRSISVEKINGEPARESKYLEPLATLFDVELDHKNVILRKSIGRTLRQSTLESS